MVEDHVLNINLYITFLKPFIFTSSQISREWKLRCSTKASMQTSRIVGLLYMFWNCA